MKHYSKVRRGMVFWFDPAVYSEKSEFKVRGTTMKSSVQSFNRPYLVVSNDENNLNSSTCNIVPITLEDKNPIPVHVNYIYNGKRQTILVEQIRTVDVGALGDYMYMVTDEVLQEVERAMTIQFSVRPSISYADFELESTMKQLEDIISGIIQAKVQEIKVQQNTIPVSQIEDTALKLGQMIEDLLVTPQPVEQKPTETKPIIPEIPSQAQEDKPKETTSKEPIKNTSDFLRKRKDYSGMSPIEKFNAKYSIGDSENVDSKTLTAPKDVPKDTSKDDKTSGTSGTSGKGKRNVWNTETRKQYLEDCDKLSPQEIMKKYNLKNIKAVYQTKYLCKNALKTSEG